MTGEEIELLTTDMLVEELASRFDNFFLVAAHPRWDCGDETECDYVGRWKADGSGLMEDFIMDACGRAGLFNDEEDWL